MRDLGFDARRHPQPHRPGHARPAADSRGRRRAASRSASPTRSRPSTRSSARRCSARCSTPRATTSPTAPSGSRCSSRAGPTCARGSSPHDGVLAGKFVGDRPAPAFEPQRIGCPRQRRDAARRLARTSGRGRLLLRSRECSRRWRRSSGVEVEVVPGRASRSCIPDAAVACWSAGEDVGLDRRDSPAGLPRLGPRVRPPASSSTSRRWSRPRRSARRPTRT